MSTSDLSFRDLAVPYFENVFIDLETVLKKYGLTSYLIGASAIAIQLLRDGIKPSRGTKDIDFAVMIDSKKEYDKIANELQGKGYNKVRAPWTFYNPEYNVVLDLLPFGKIEEEFTEDFSQRKTSLHFLGFTEILKDSESIAVSGQSINVPSLPGMVILKLIAWNDRPEERDKDLYDILKVIEN